MPSETPKQHHLMEAVAHGWKKPGGGGPSVAVAKEFVAADKGKYDAQQAAPSAEEFLSSKAPAPTPTPEITVSMAGAPRHTGADIAGGQSAEEFLSGGPKAEAAKKPMPTAEQFLS